MLSTFTFCARWTVPTIMHSTRNLWNSMHRKAPQTAVIVRTLLINDDLRPMSSYWTLHLHKRSYYISRNSIFTFKRNVFEVRYIFKPILWKCLFIVWSFHVFFFRLTIFNDLLIFFAFLTSELLGLQNPLISGSSEFSVVSKNSFFFSDWRVGAISSGALFLIPSSLMWFFELAPYMCM